jgi:hypothetical protein
LYEERKQEYNQMQDYYKAETDKELKKEWLAEILRLADLLFEGEEAAAIEAARLAAEEEAAKEAAAAERRAKKKREEEAKLAAAGLDE